jgi:hypothetical protein
MKRLILSISLGATVAAPVPSQAWVSYCHAGGWGHASYGHVGYTHVGWGGACWHGGWNCGGVSTGTAVAAGMAGLATGAMIGSAASKTYVPPVVVAPAPVVVAPAPVVVMPAAVVVQPAIPIGSIYYALPADAKGANINGVEYYVANNVYYRPYFGSNGVYYQVVANPI